MATLSQVSSETKTLFKWAGIILGSLLAIFILFQTFKFIKNTFFPTPIRPTLAFGKLPPPNFSFTPGKHAYSLDTTTGNLPQLPPILEVYKMEEPSPNLLALEKAKALVGSAGFTANPLKISNNVYQWTDEKGRALTLNITDLNFNVISDFLSSNNRPLVSFDEEKAKEKSQAFLQNIGLFPPDLDLSKTQTSLFVIKNYSIVPASSLSEAQTVRVSFSQRNWNNLPVFYPEFNVSPMNFLVGGLGGEPEVVEANFFYQRISNASATYPIKTPSEAFEDLKKGKAFIAKDEDSKKITIKNVELGYFMSDRKQNFLLPVVVFEGDNFAAYVPALKDEWVNK